ncbi:YihY/virulence factor BrkB family protein [Haloprofundus salinisoli]|uniref:YihY/virulence factor BrkB family protein n=1 Tax=Haloprofundus salinisoli TaxID=2876193 RepID=UPI001CCAC20F|nr:YihY/virulence factor BrkB family protein [Haloprofundus salinisoli]
MRVDFGGDEATGLVPAPASTSGAEPTVTVSTTLPAGFLAVVVVRSVMSPSRERVVTVGRALLHEIRVEKLTFLAGSIAYHAFVSLLPFFALALAAFSAVGDGSFQRGFESLVGTVLAPGTGDQLIRDLSNASGSTSLSVAGVVFLLWGAMRIFRGLDTAFSDIYETEAENTFQDQILDAIVVLGTVAIAIFAAVQIEQFGLAQYGVGGRLLQLLLLVGGLTLTFLPMYYIFPDTDVSVVEILPGTVFAAVGLTVFQFGFQYYAAANSDGPGNLLAVVLLVLTWLYFSGLVVLVGVAINAVLSNRSADVSIEPVVGGVRPEHTAERASEAELAAALTELDRLLDAGDEITVEVGDGSVTLPKPQRIATETDGSLLRLSDGGYGLELRWSVRDEE